MICMNPAHGPWCDCLLLPAVKWFEFLCLPKACAKEGLMIEKKYFTAAIATMNRAGPILSSSRPSIDLLACSQSLVVRHLQIKTQPSILVQ